LSPFTSAGCNPILDRDPSSESLLPWRDKTYKWKPLITFWTFRTGKRWLVKNLCAVYSNTLLRIKSFADCRGQPHGPNFPTKPAPAGFQWEIFLRDARRLKASEPVIATAVSDDVSRSPEPALPDGSCFRHFLCWFHHSLFILRSMRRGRMGALSMYQSPRYPYGSISRWNLALALKCRFLEHHRRHPPPTRSITPRPKLEIH
jgi:hypothetical protein